MYPILFEFKGIQITTFGLMLGLGFLAAGWIGTFQFEDKGYEKDASWTVLMGALIGGIVGAKLYYAFLNWPVLVRDPLGTLFSRAGLVWYGGLIGGAIGVIFVARRAKFPIPVVADAAALMLSIGYAIGRIGCFLVGDDYGRPTDSWVGLAFPKGSPPSTAGNLRDSFGVNVPATIPDWEVLRVHPTQLYETTMMLIVFAVLWRLRRHRHRAGWLFMLYLMLAGLERAFIEIFRAKDDRFFGPFTLAQLISLVIIAGGAYGFFALRRGRGEPAPAAP
jgi:phosphatidylglycerol:prolipoprotein diacylglycerol transferase